MTTTPTIEKTEEAKCSTCMHDCVRLCAICGSNFCTRHLLTHSQNCSGYKDVISAVLRDNLETMTRQVVHTIMTM